jgi:outer membrane protein OmpA-like peptidoglycan-associated protein
MLRWKNLQAEFSQMCFRDATLITLSYVMAMKKFNRQYLLVAMFSFVASSVLAVTTLVPEGAQELFAKSYLGSAAIPIAPADAGVVEHEYVIGQIQQQAWRIPSTNANAILEAMVARYEREKFEVNFNCVSTSCGGFEFRYALDTPSPRLLDIQIANYIYYDLRSENAVVTLLASQGNDTVDVLQIIVEKSSDQAIAFSEQTQSSPSLNARLILEDVRFESGSSQIAEYGSDELQSLADRLEAEPTLSLYIVGHSDQEGGLEGNLAISERRARAVRELLISEFGVSAARLQAKGVAFLAPIADNATEEGRARNRRVEAVFLEN